MTTPSPAAGSKKLNPIDGYLLEMLGDYHRHLCVSCDGVKDGCINCRHTGYDQTPCKICDKDGIAFRNRREFLDKVRAYIAAQNNATYEAVMEAIGEDEAESELDHTLSNFRSMDEKLYLQLQGRDLLRNELRQSIAKIFSKEGDL